MRIAVFRLCAPPCSPVAYNDSIGIVTPCKTEFRGCVGGKLLGCLLEVVGIVAINDLNIIGDVLHVMDARLGKSVLYLRAGVVNVAEHLELFRARPTKALVRRRRCLYKDENDLYASMPSGVKQWRNARGCGGPA